MKRVVLGQGKLSAWSRFGRWQPSAVLVSGGLKFSKRLIGKKVRLIAEILPLICIVVLQLGCKRGPSASDIPTLQSVCDNHKTKCEVSLNCSNTSKPDVFLYRNMMDMDSMALLRVTPTELEKILNALENR